jgi:hypothetical protein
VCVCMCVGVLVCTRIPSVMVVVIVSTAFWLIVSRVATRVVAMA